MAEINRKQTGSISVPPRHSHASWRWSVNLHPTSLWSSVVSLRTALRRDVCTLQCKKVIASWNWWMLSTCLLVVSQEKVLEQSFLGRGQGFLCVYVSAGGGVIYTSQHMRHIELWLIYNPVITALWVRGICLSVAFRCACVHLIWTCSFPHWSALQTQTKRATQEYVCALWVWSQLELSFPILHSACHHEQSPWCYEFTIKYKPRAYSQPCGLQVWLLNPFGRGACMLSKNFH